jgi:transposase
MNIHYKIELEADERRTLVDLIAGGDHKARKIKRAQILLAVDRGVHGGGQLTDEQIAQTLAVGTSTVFRVKRKFVEENLEAALAEEPRPGGERKTNAKQDAALIALACTKPPEGCAKWTLRLLADLWVELSDLEDVSLGTVRRRLDENELKPWQKKMWCIPKFDLEYVARMEDVLDLYAQPPDPQRPVVCFDETPRQLIGETRVPVAAKPGRPERYDYEYKRNGTANVFVMIDRHRSWRNAEVTDRHTQVDFAQQMRKLVDEHYPEADLIRVVMDNLNTHKSASLYAAFEPAEARRILRKLEFHFTPKHASWLNMAEIEIGVMIRQCLDRRIGDKDTLTNEIEAWKQRRNAAGETIRWMFTVEQARKKLRRAYRSDSL